MYHKTDSSARAKEPNLTINYDILEKPQEKILTLLAFIGMPVVVTDFVHYVHKKLQINSAGDWLTNGVLVNDIQFRTADGSDELTVVFTGTPASDHYSDEMRSLLDAIFGTPGMQHRVHWLPTRLTFDDLVSLPEFGVLASESKLMTIQNYFGLDAAKFVAGYYVRHEDNEQARKRALGRFHDIYSRRPGRWLPETFLSQVDLNVMMHPSKRRRTREDILAEMRNCHDTLISLAAELGNL